MKRFLNRPLDPDGRIYTMVRAISYAFQFVGVLKPNRVFNYVYSGDSVLILTPLSGSSSVKLSSKKSVAAQFQPRTNVYVLWRDNADRMQSTYNKKIRNPASLFKAMQQVTLGGLNPDSSVDHFLDYLECMENDYNKDKHFFLNEEILSYHKLREDEIEKLDIRKDLAVLQDVFGVHVSFRKNSSEEKAVYQEIVVFSDEHRQRVSQMETRLKATS